MSPHRPSAHSRLDAALASSLRCTAKAIRAACTLVATALVAADRIALIATNVAWPVPSDFEAAVSEGAKARGGSAPFLDSARHSGAGRDLSNAQIRRALAKWNVALVARARREGRFEERVDDRTGARRSIVHATPVVAASAIWSVEDFTDPNWN